MIRLGGRWPFEAPRGGVANWLVNYVAVTIPRRRVDRQPESRALDPREVVFMSSQPANHAPDIGRLCQRKVICIEPGEDIGSAARLMRAEHVGCLIVTEPGSEVGTQKVVGVLTDRDIVVSVVAREVEPRSLKVGDVMTRNPLVVREDDSLDATLIFMREAGVRRVPVIGAHAELVGILSLDDVLEKIVQQLTNIAGSIRSEQRTERLVRP